MNTGSAVSKKISKLKHGNKQNNILDTIKLKFGVFEREAMQYISLFNPLE